MTSTNLKFSESHPKRSDITGSCEDAFGLGTDLQTTIINSIRANTLVAIGIVAFGSLETQFIFNTQVYTKPNGTPIPFWEMRPIKWESLPWCLFPWL
jgi:hypothetical protein